LEVLDAEVEEDEKEGGEGDISMDG
jgi:hypothetical protein